jgi:hypothetical protein
MALINSMGALGSFGGSYLVGYLNSTTGSPGASYLLMSGALMLSVVLTIFLKPGASDRVVAKAVVKRPMAAHP